MCKHEARRRFECWDVLQELFELDAIPLCIELTPAGHAMNISGDMCGWQSAKLIEAEARRCFDLAPYPQIPGIFEIAIGWHITIVQHWEFLGQILPRWNAILHFGCGAIIFFAKGVEHRMCSLFDMSR